MKLTHVLSLNALDPMPALGRKIEVSPFAQDPRLGAAFVKCAALLAFTAGDWSYQEGVKRTFSGGKLALHNLPKEPKFSSRPLPRLSGDGQRSVTGRFTGMRPEMGARYGGTWPVLIKPYKGPDFDKLEERVSVVYYDELHETAARGESALQGIRSRLQVLSDYEAAETLHEMERVREQMNAMASVFVSKPAVLAVTRMQEAYQRAAERDVPALVLLETIRRNAGVDFLDHVPPEKQEAMAAAFDALLPGPTMHGVQDAAGAALNRMGYNKEPLRDYLTSVGVVKITHLLPHQFADAIAAFDKMGRPQPTVSDVAAAYQEAVSRNSSPWHARLKVCKEHLQGGAYEQIAPEKRQAAIDACNAL